MKKYYGVGFIGDGIYGGKKGDRKEYDVWRSMLSRCYNEKDRKYSIYGGRGCSVCKEWHNLQTFAKWYNLNYKDGYAIDKDIKYKGNKIYSPDTCVLIPKVVNDFLISKRSDSKSGIRGLSWSDERKKWIVSCSNFNTKKYKNYGRFSNKNTAIEKLIELRNNNFKLVKYFLVNECSFNKIEVERYESISNIEEGGLNYV